MAAAPTATAAAHAAYVRHLTNLINHDFTMFYSAPVEAFSNLTPQEYKHLALTAFRLMVHQFGIIADPNTSPGAWAAHHMTKCLFEEQSIIDPRADPLFINQLEDLSPYYIGRYIHTLTPDQFADLAAGQRAKTI